MKITEHFTLIEFEKSTTAKEHGINNHIPDEYMQSVINLARVLEKVRVKFGKPIRVTSGYRCPELNALVKGSKTSQHLYAQAADITSSNNAKLFKLILEMIQSGEIVCSQLIWEYGSKKSPAWIHIGLYTGKKRNQILYYYN